MKKKLVLLGGGHAHVCVLKSLTLVVPQPFDEVEVTLISPYARQIYSGMLPGWVAGHYVIEQCVISLPPQARALYLMSAGNKCAIRTWGKVA